MSSLLSFRKKVFSREEATIYDGVSVGRSVCPSADPSVRRMVGNQFFFRPTRNDARLAFISGILGEGLSVRRSVRPSVGLSVGIAFFVIPKMRN